MLALFFLLSLTCFEDYGELVEVEALLSKFCMAAHKPLILVVAHLMEDLELLLFSTSSSENAAYKKCALSY